MAIKTKSLLNRIIALLNDEEHERWPEDELLEWLNDGQRIIARETTDGNVVRANITAVVGTVQSIPAAGFRLIDVVKDTATGSDIKHADYDSLGAYNRTWRQSSSGVAELYFFNESRPKEFEVFPPQGGGELIEILYTAIPDNTTVSGEINIDDIYADSLVDYVVYRALSKDTEDTSPELGRATAFYRAFLMAIGKKDQVDMLVEPQRSESG